MVPDDGYSRELVRVSAVDRVSCHSGACWPMLLLVTPSNGWCTNGPVQ